MFVTIAVVTSCNPALMHASARALRSRRKNHRWSAVEDENEHVILGGSVLEPNAALDGDAVHLLDRVLLLLDGAAHDDRKLKDGDAVNVLHLAVVALAVEHGDLSSARSSHMQKKGMSAEQKQRVRCARSCEAREVGVTGSSACTAPPSHCVPRRLASASHRDDTARPLLEIA